MYEKQSQESTVQKIGSGKSGKSL